MTPLPASPLSIAVIGMGGIGSTFAFQFARAGHQVTAIARPDSPRLKQLQQDGAIVNTEGERAAVQVADTLDGAVPYDLVLVTLLAHQVATVLPTLLLSTAGCIQFMFNQFDPENLQASIGAERCSFGMPFVQAVLDPQGRLQAKIGAPGQKSKMNDRRWVDLFNAAGLPAVFEPNMLLWLRCHVPLCIAFESISVAAMRRNAGATWSEAVIVARGARQSFSLIQRLGYRLYPAGKSLLHSSPAFVLASVLWGMSRIPSFRQLLATGIGECRALTDVLLTAAQSLDPPLPTAAIAAMKP